MWASKIMQNLKGQDKLLHSLIGNLIFLVTFIIAVVITQKITLSIFAAFIVLLSLAFAKELFDKFIKKTFIDWYDIVAAFVPYCVTYIINKDE